MNAWTRSSAEDVSASGERKNFWSGHTASPYSPVWINAMP
jgi:hypothetical protein